MTSNNDQLKYTFVAVYNYGIRKNCMPVGPV